MGIRRDVRVAERRRDVAAQYLRGTTQAEIAQKWKVSQAQISYDLKYIHAAWMKAAVFDFDEAKARELARIDILEREYWQAWERSQTKREKTLVEKKTGVQGHDKSQIRREEHVGDARFLDGVRWCIEQRLKIFGVYDADRQTGDYLTWLKEHGIESPGAIFDDLVGYFATKTDALAASQSDVGGRTETGPTPAAGAGRDGGTA